MEESEEKKTQRGRMRKRSRYNISQRKIKQGNNRRWGISEPDYGRQGTKLSQLPDRTCETGRIKELCPSMKTPQLCRGVTIFVVTKTTDYGDGGSPLTLTLSIERSEQLSTSFHSSLNMQIERNVGLRATGQVMRKTAVSLRLQMLASTMPSRTYSSHQLSW